MDFVSVRTATLRGGLKIGFDVYVKVGSKFITYVRKGDSFDGTRLERLKAKKLKKLFIRPDEELLYREYVTKNIDMAYTNKDAPMQERVEVIQGAQHASTEAVLESPENQDNYNNAKNGATRYVEFLMKEEKAIQTMLNIENTDRDLAHHGVAVSTLAVLIGTKMGVPAPRMPFLALGALLHDFGHANMTYPLFQNLNDLTPEAKAEYMKHSMQGGETVRVHRHFDDSVIKIIVQHEELSDGSGYPQKLIEKNTDPLAVIVSTANAFDRLMLNEKVSRADALRKFTVDRVGRHPLEHIKIFKTIV